MNAKKNAINHIKKEQKWIVFHDREGENLDSYEISYHAFDIIEEAINIAIEDTKKEIKEKVEKEIDNFINDLVFILQDKDRKNMIKNLKIIYKELKSEIKEILK